MTLPWQPNWWAMYFLMLIGALMWLLMILGAGVLLAPLFDIGSGIG